MEKQKLKMIRSRSRHGKRGRQTKAERRVVGRGLRRNNLITYLMGIHREGMVRLCEEIVIDSHLDSGEIKRLIADCQS